MSSPVPISGLRLALPLAAIWPEVRDPAEGRLYGALRRDGIHDVGSLTRTSASHLLALDGFGPWALGEVRSKLARLGLALLGEEVVA